MSTNDLDFGEEVRAAGNEVKYTLSHQTPRTRDLGFPVDLDAFSPYNEGAKAARTRNLPGKIPVEPFARASFKSIAESVVFDRKKS